MARALQRKKKLSTANIISPATFMSRTFIKLMQNLTSPARARLDNYTLGPGE
jgi:hypothetical protein